MIYKYLLFIYDIDDISKLFIQYEVIIITTIN